LKAERDQLSAQAAMAPRERSFTGRLTDSFESAFMTPWYQKPSSIATVCGAGAVLALIIGLSAG
jgi:hypothetical protein